MKWLWNVVSLVLIVVGVIWILQGANLLQGSFMTGRIEWFFAGIASLIIGVMLPVYMKRRQQDDTT